MSRMIKWVGDPPVLQADGWRVANWRYENRRKFPIALPKGHPGDTRRIVGVEDGFSQNYLWCNANNFVCEMKDHDAELLLKVCPREFRDVTMIHPEDWHKVVNDPIIKPATPGGPVLYYGRR